ncbi:toll/interleukin-1 receptor domain-containing protein [Puteibacter caeruleilacunae]|nr:toll/interleukin-1 receptor domain-containing protein [Puteibacter caeruleilacunae]
MGQSVLVFISHSSEDKESLIEPIVSDLENCYINVWLDKRKILPGDNLRKSVFRDGLDKADVALIFFTEKSLKSSWVDREIKHVLREESKKGNNFDLSKIISIFDSQKTYDEVAERYPELTDDLLHFLPQNYDKIELGQLVSAIWSKYLSLQGGDIETQRQLLVKEKEIFQREKDIQGLKVELDNLKEKNSKVKQIDEFKQFCESGKISDFIETKENILIGGWAIRNNIENLPEAVAFGLVEDNPRNNTYVKITEKGKDFFKWYLMKNN